MSSGSSRRGDALVMMTVSLRANAAAPICRWCWWMWWLVGGKKRQRFRIVMEALQS